MYRLEELAQMVGGKLVGPPTIEIRSVAPIDEAGPHDISMAAESHYIKMIPESRAGAFLVGEDVEDLSRPCIQVANPRLAFVTLLAAFDRDERPPVGIHDTVIVGEDVTYGTDVRIAPYVTIGERTVIGNDVTLYPGVRIGNDVHIGDGTIVYQNAVIRSRTKIGRNGIIHANAVLGSDGYGFVPDDSGPGHLKVPHIGSVEIGDDVEIGAAVTVDRGTCGSTRIGRGTKIGNLTQVAHNVQIGEDCRIVGMAGIAGSSHLGDRVTLAGQVGLVGHIEIGDDAIIGARGLVTKNVPAGTFISGSPGRPHAESLRIQAGMSRLPQSLQQMRALERRVVELETALKQLLKSTPSEATSESEEREE